MDQLEWESRSGRLAAFAAFASAVLAVASVIVYNATVGTYSDSAELLLSLHDEPAGAIGGSVLQAVALLLLIPILLFLFAATRYRRPEETPAQLRPLVLFAPPIAAILSVVTAILQVRAANNLFPELPLPPELAVDRADHFIREAPAPLVGYVLFAVNFAVGGAIALVSLNAMRAGLLSRFIGILGIILGVLTAIPFFFGGPSIIQFFWLLAIGVLFLNRWPGQRGPAWETGEAIPWPTAAEVRARQLEERDAEREPEPAQTAVATAEHPRSKKRKRKRRR
jgi:hypothetical protein